MAHTQSHPGYDFSPEEAIEEIKADRKRRSWMAAAAFVAAAIALSLGVYMSYRDVPVQSSPANTTQSVQP